MHPEHSTHEQSTHLSTAIATRVKTEAETEVPWIRPLILHTTLVNGQPVNKRAKSAHDGITEGSLKGFPYSS